MIEDQNYSYVDAVKYIDDIPMFGPTVNGRNKSGNDNLIYILEKLGHPEQKKKTIHIAGTNGKGSVSRLVASILNEVGYEVGVFNSPHLIKINERISISEQQALRDIDNTEFVECFHKVQRACKEAVAEGYMHLSYFEFLFAMATVFYSDKNVDYVIYETGLGGRLDATNVLLPEVSVITSIGLDHMKYLGNTIKDIAGEKAGIIKTKVPVVYNTGDEIADLVVETTANLHDALAINVAKTDYMIYEITDKTIDFSMSNRYYNYNHLILPSGFAVYQVYNTMTAVTVCNYLLNAQVISDIQHGALNDVEKRITYEQVISEEKINLALQRFVWPGRMEQVLPNVILDGAHNEDAIEQFISSVQQGFSEKKIRILFAVAADKDYEPMIKMLCEKLDIETIYVTAIQSERAISSEYIGGLFKMYQTKYHEATLNASLNTIGDNSQSKDKFSVICDDDIKQIFLKAYHDVKGTDAILFCLGSLYLVGSLKQIAREVI